jgi:hypothetical protein
VKKVSLDMATKVRITGEASKRYRRASKKEKKRFWPFAVMVFVTRLQATS